MPRAAAATLLPRVRDARPGRWPRLPEMVIPTLDASDTMFSGNGQAFDSGCEHALVFALGNPGPVLNLSVAQGVTSNRNLWPLVMGLPLPSKFKLVAGVGPTGKFSLVGWQLTDQEASSPASLSAAIAAAASSVNLPQFPSPSALNDADPNPTTTRVGSNNLLWNISAAKWERLAAQVWGTDNMVLVDGPFVAAAGIVQNDRTGGADRLRQPNTTAPKSILQSAVSIQTTGVKATRTMAQDGYIRSASVAPVSGTPTNAVVLLQIVRSAVTYEIGYSGPLSATLNVNYILVGNTQNPGGVPVLSGDVVQANVVTAAGAAAAADFQIGFEENRFVQ